MKQISDNEIYLLIKYIKSVLRKVVKRLSYIQDAWCLKVKFNFNFDSKESDVTRAMLLGKPEHRCEQGGS